MENAMRKILFISLLAAGLLPAMAGEYGYLVFTNTSGTTTALTVSNLSATVSGSTLVVTNDDGTLSFTLTELASMQFSATTPVTALENILNGDQPVQVYSIGGTSLGTFDNLVQATQQLDRGTYVIVQTGKSQKLVVK